MSASDSVWGSLACMKGDRIVPGVPRHAPGYFGPFLSGRLRHAEDDNGRIFIDRSPDLFAYMPPLPCRERSGGGEDGQDLYVLIARYILQYLRAMTVPMQYELRRMKQDLIAECAFWDVPSLASRLEGVVAASDMRPEDRKIRDLEAAPSGHSSILIDLYAASYEPRPAEDLQITLLPRTAPRALLSGGLQDCKRRLNLFTQGLVDRLAGAQHVVFAGGAVTAAVRAGGLCAPPPR